MIKMGDNTKEKMVTIFEILSKPNMIETIASLQYGYNMTQAKLGQELDISQPAISSYLALLEKHRIVGYKCNNPEDARIRTYYVCDKQVRTIISSLFEVKKTIGLRSW